MRARNTSIDFSLSFLDLLLSGVGGVAILVTIFAALGRAPNEPTRPVSRGLVVELLDPETGFQLGDEIGFHLAEPDSAEPPITDDKESGWGAKPGTKHSIAVPEREEAPPLELRLFVKRVSAEKAADPKYRTAFEQGIAYRLSWSTEQHQPLVSNDTLVRSGGFQRVMRLEAGESPRDCREPPPWFERSLLPPPPPPGHVAFRKSKMYFSALDWSEDLNFGYLLRPVGAKSIHIPYRIESFDEQDPFIRTASVQLKPLRAWTADDYATIGRRGACAVDTAAGETLFRPRGPAEGGRDHGPMFGLLGLQPGPDGFLRLDSAAMRRHARSGLRKLDLSDSELDRRLADALADGFGRDRPAGPVTKQDPLLWPRPER